MDYGMDDFDLLDDQPTPFARWALPALTLSILLHIGALLWLSQHELLGGFAPAPPEPPPPTFTLARLPIEPTLLEPPKPAATPKPARAPTAVELPKEKPSFDRMMSETKGQPAAPKIENPLLAEKPQIDATSYTQTVQDAEQGGVKSVARELDQVREDLLSEKAGVAGKPLLDIAKPAPDSGASPSTAGPYAGADQPGFSNLDALLAETGPLTSETAPIRMDSDVLYTYNSYELQADSVASLEKLGLIIRKNPQLDFTIEGHSDSSGEAGYNLWLSEQRALAVKTWLVQVMRIEPSRIRTQGYGDERLIVPATVPFDEQKETPNRRVEIVLHDRAQTP